MEPREKAKELVGKFMPLADSGGYYDDRSYNVGDDKEANAKQCALIAVDEILGLNIEEWCQVSEPYQDYSYWEKVKQEIEKL